MLQTFLVCLLFIQSISSGWAQTPRPRWISLDGKSEPGSPIRMEVVGSSQESTRLELNIPGFWVETEIYGGRSFSSIRFSEALLTGKGFPVKKEEAGWYDFPQEARQPLLSAERYQRALNIGIPQSIFPEKAVNEKPTTGAEMERLGIDPAGARPGIPALRGALAVSIGNEGKDLAPQTISRGTSTIQLELPLTPAGFEGSDQTREDDGYTPPQLIDEEFYRNFKGEYRSKEEPIIPAGRSGAFSVADLRIPLFEVLTPNSISIFTNLVIEFKHLKGTEDFKCPLSWDNWIFKLPFINGEALREALTAKGIKIEASRSAHYLILTPREYRTNLTAFALWKQSKGLNVDFAYVGNADTDDVVPDRNKIDQYIEAYFEKNYCHGVYVLLIGDTGVIPTGRSTMVTSGPDGNDGDSDHVYEVLGNDRFPSLYVGRLSINSAAELDNQLEKTLSYERSPVSGDWPLQATLAANSQNNDDTTGVSASFPSKYAAAVNSIATYGGYTAAPVFQRLHAGGPNAAAIRATNQDVIDAVNAGRGHLLYRGHGSGSAWVSGWDAMNSSWTMAHVGQLANTAYPIVYSIACQNNRIRNDDSIGETWMNQVGGGSVAHWGASVNSFTGENHERAKGIFRAFYESGFTRLAPALAEAERISFTVTGGGGSWDNNTFCYLLLGDPELTVRKKAISARINLSLSLSNLVNGSLAVLVRNTEGQIQPGAFVNVLLQDGRSLNGFASPDGDLILPDISLDKVARVEVQADGYKPESTAPLGRRWISFNGQTEPGTPATMDVLKTSKESTTVGVQIPGVWLHTEMYAGRTFTRVELPAVQLGGRGFPQKAGDRGWYDFPEETRYPLLDPAPFRNAIQSGIARPVFPRKAAGQTPSSGDEMLRLGIDPTGARPGVPNLRGFVAVSKMNSPEDVSILPQTVEGMLIGLLRPIMPAGFEGLDQTEPLDLGYTAPQLVDEDFYADFKGEYRGTERPVSEISSAGVFSAAEFRFPAMEVIDATTIRFFTNLVFEIKHLKGTEDFDCPLNWDNWLFKMPFINGEALREALTAKGLKIEASRSAHYLILTPREYRSDLNALALWKQSKGLNVQFAYVGNGANDDVLPDRTKIDQYIEGYFRENYCHGLYVLLIGDTDVLPTGRSARVDSAPDEADADSDHVYEVLGNDRFPSIYVGRLSINNSNELKNQLAKILSYEKNPVSGDWPTQVTLAANSQNDDGTTGVSMSFPSKYAAAVNAITSFIGYTSPPTFQRLHAGAATAAGIRAVNQDVIDAVEAGRGQVLYRGHGSGTGWVGGWDGSSADGTSFTAMHINQMDNTAYPIVYSIACQNGRIRNNESIAESWMSRTNGGAVAHWGASVNSYTGENHERAKGIFKALYQKGFTRLAPALAEAERLSHLATGGGGAWDNNTFCYLLLGDPELTVRKKRIVPDIRLSLAYSNLLNGGLLIQVRDSQATMQPGAFVNVVLDDGRTFNGFTSPDGDLVLPNLRLENVVRIETEADGFEPYSTRTEPPAVRRWISFDGTSEPGSPATAEVIKSTQEETTLRIKLRGAWFVTSTYGGRMFTRIEIPEVGELDGLGFPHKAGERGWFDFPEETGYPLLNPDRYRKALGIGIAKALYPESAVGQNPKTVEEMRRLGIDPVGARPGVPHLRGFVASARLASPGELQIETSPQGGLEMNLSAPLMPAGFEGSDQAAPPERQGYTAPQLVDEEFYATFKGQYRGEEIGLSQLSGLGVFSGAEMRVPLLEVIDGLNIRIFTNLVVNVKHLKGTEDFACPFNWDNWIFKFPFINGAALRGSLTAKGIRIEASRSAHYLIITPREYRNNLNSFALWKQAKGLNVDFAYVGNAASDDVTPDRNQIDQYIEKYFEKNYCHGVYVLLVGDTDVIPTGRSTRVVAGPDGNDADSDHVYEVLGNDLFPSLYVGRLSINSAAELDNQLAKILSYERSPVSGDWPLQASLAANSENDDGTRGVSMSFPSKYAAAVDAIAAYGSYSSPPTFQKLHAGAANAASTRAVNQDVIDAIQAGRGHVLYRGHGDGNSWVGGWDGSSMSGSSWTPAEIGQLSNRAYPIVYSIACQNGRIRNNDAVSELWMNWTNGGAVAHWGASVNSYTGENHERSKGIFRALYESGFTRLAPALAEAERISHVSTGGGSSWDNNTFCYLLLGDPELTIRKRRVTGFRITTLVSNIQDRAVVLLRDGLEGVAIPGGFVNVTLIDGRKTNGFTRMDGTLVLPGIKAVEIARIDVNADGYPSGETTMGTGEQLIRPGFSFKREEGFKFRMEGPLQTYEVQVSENLETWRTIHTFTGSSIDYTDNPTVKVGALYYRVIPVAAAL